MDGCALWVSCVTTVGGAMSLLFVYQLCVTNIPESKNTICWLPMKRLMQLLGLCGSLMFLVGWGITSAECVDMAPAPTVLSRAAIKFSLDGLSVLFVLQYVLGTTTFLNAIATSSRSRNNGKPPLFVGAVVIVMVWLILDIYQVCLDKEWVSAVFYWWLMASLWGVFIYFAVVACKLAGLLQQEAKPPAQGLLRQTDASPAEDWEEQARKAKRVIWKVKVLLISTACALLLASWFWVAAGILILSNTDALLTDPNRHFEASLVFCLLHAFGLLVCCWWVWQPADKSICERRRLTRVLRATREPSEWFEASVTEPNGEGRSPSVVSVCDSPHSLNPPEPNVIDTAATMMSLSGSTRKLNTWVDRSAQLKELIRSSSAKTFNTI